MKKAAAFLFLVSLLWNILPASNAGAAEQKELKKFVFVVPRSLECMDDIAIWAADHLGYFKEEGIEVVMEQAMGTTDIKMVGMGQADGAYPSPNLILASMEQGLPVKVVSASDAINIFGMAFRPDSGIKTWADLKGKTVALGDAAWATIAAPTISAAGLDPEKDIEYVVAGEARYQMVNEKKIDVLFTWVTEYEQLKGQGFDFLYLDGNEVLPVYANPIITSDAVIAKDPELLTRFIRAKNKGQYFAACNPAAGADIVLNKFPSIQITWEGALGSALGRKKQSFGVDPATEKKILERGIGVMDDATWQTIIDWALKVGVISKPIAPSQVYTNQYIDTTWDKAAVEKDAAAYICTSEVYKNAHK